MLTKVRDHLQAGTVARLNTDAGFGYVRESKGERSYMFVLGKAITHKEAAHLKVGSSVRFQVGDRGRVSLVKPG